jgi:transposase
MSTRLSEIRKRIQKQRGVELKKHTRKPTHISDLPTPYKKTRLMQLIEYRFNIKLEKLIFTGTIYEVEKKIGVDASTISKWRKIIDEAFFKQFE